MLQEIEHSDPGNHDEIVTMAVRDFCGQARPLRDDVARLVDLVMPLLKSISDGACRQIAAMLADSPFAPKTLLLALCDRPVSICSPILTRSRLLNNAELLAIISQHGEHHARAIARRPDLDMQVSHMLRSLENDGVHRALDLRQRLDGQQSEAESAPEDDPVRQFERFQSALHGNIAKHAGPAVAIEINDLIALAIDPNPALLHTAIADALAITVASSAALCANPTSKNLLYMLRFIGAPDSKAFEFFAALAPDRAAPAGVGGQFQAVFETVTIEQAVRKVWSWRSDDLFALAREAMAANDPGATGIVHPGLAVDEYNLKVA
jgi:uncharacterized protein (DUF2336 family)